MGRFGASSQDRVAGCAGLEPVASGVTGSEDGVAADRSSWQPVATIGNRRARSTDFCPGLGALFRRRVPPGLQSPERQAPDWPGLLSVRDAADRFRTSVSRRDRDARPPAEHYSRSKTADWSPPLSLDLQDERVSAFCNPGARRIGRRRFWRTDCRSRPLTAVSLGVQGWQRIAGAGDGRARRNGVRSRRRRRHP